MTTNLRNLKFKLRFIIALDQELYSQTGSGIVQRKWREIIGMMS